ncbi:hypothetical protein [Puerhibacterium puerhi]|uniref:hypothetical protein n=1 Tax=Puerhibacterium puerhi TaxID=2692623 RepID=UPI001356E0C5|nr:hypothetical protein [Puerhibacterium puerhi]
MKTKAPVSAVEFPVSDLPDATIDTGNSYSQTKIVRFRSITPAQRAETREAAIKAAERHYQLAEDHIAAALWLRYDYEPKPEPHWEERVENLAITLVKPEPHLSTDDFHQASINFEREWGAWPNDLAYFGRDPFWNIEHGKVHYRHHFGGKKVTRVLVDAEGNSVEDED